MYARSTALILVSKIVSCEMQDQEETCPCGYTLDECRCRQRQLKPQLGEPVHARQQPFEFGQRLEQMWGGAVP
jgi:hypothetical protein